MRIGAVNYLNSKPLVVALPPLAPDARIVYDLPSRLADSLAAGRLDVALIPSVEFFRTPGHRIVSDACVACCGPVLSVKLHFRVSPTQVRRLALDEGSRTSAALSQILLSELCGVRPKVESLPIGCGPEKTDADAVLLIGDRAFATPGLSPGNAPSTNSSFIESWDLGERWLDWTGLPFVFAMWIARIDANTSDLAPLLNAARDQGVERIDEIAAHEAPLIGIREEVAKAYLRDNLHFTVAEDEGRAVRRFYELCVEHKLAPVGLENTIRNIGKPAACRK